MKRNNERNEAGKAETSRKRSRFRIDKLEERIAPKKGGNKNITANCASDWWGGGGY